MDSPSHSRSPTVLSPEKGRTIAVVGDTYRFLATGAETAGRYAQFEAWVPPGGGPPPHLHRREEEGFFILEGEITFIVGDRRLTATPGTFANMPIGMPHTFKNETDRSARMLVTVAPAGLEEFFFEVGRPTVWGPAAPAPTPDEIQRLLAAAPRFGIEMLLSPP